MEGPDHHHMDGLQDAANALDGRLREGETTVIGVREEYDGYPVNHDLKMVLEMREDIPGGDLLQAEKLEEFADDYFDTLTYIDWTMDGFDDLEMIDEYRYRDIDMIIEVYEPGDEHVEVARDL